MIQIKAEPGSRQVSFVVMTAQRAEVLDSAYAHDRALMV